MPLQKVTLADLNTVGLEIVTEMFQRQLEIVVRDLFQRPGDKSKRRITLRLELKPRVGQDGVCDGAQGGFECYADLPRLRTNDFGFAASPTGALLLRPDSPTEPNQSTFADLGEEGDDESC